MTMLLNIEPEKGVKIREFLAGSIHATEVYTQVVEAARNAS
jgi:hypothetical protein